MALCRHWGAVMRETSFIKAFITSQRPLLVTFLHPQCGRTMMILEAVAVTDPDVTSLKLVANAGPRFDL